MEIASFCKSTPQTCRSILSCSISPLPNSNMSMENSSEQAQTYTDQCSPACLHPLFGVSCPRAFSRASGAVHTSTTWLRRHGHVNLQPQGIVGGGMVGKRWPIAAQPPAHGGRHSTWFSGGLLWDTDFTALNSDTIGTPHTAFPPSLPYTSLYFRGSCCLGTPSQQTPKALPIHDSVFNRLHTKILCGNSFHGHTEGKRLSSLLEPVQRGEGRQAVGKRECREVTKTLSRGLEGPRHFCGKGDKRFELI